MKLAWVYAIGAIVGLASCGGTTVPKVNAFAFTDIAGGITGLGALTDSLTSLEATDASTLPASGTATYDGILSVSLINNPSDAVVGTVRVETDFKERTHSGTAGDFFNLIGQQAEGELSIAGGLFLGGQSSITTSNVEGSIEFESGVKQIDITSIGVFLGDRGAVHSSVLVGEATSEGASAVEFEGVWIIEKQ